MGFSKVLAKAFLEEPLEDTPPQKYKPETLGRILSVPICDITPNPQQPRKHFDTAELTSLAKSISQDGIIQPLTVRKVESGYMLIAGERRLRAAKLAGLRNVPCITLNVEEEVSQVLSLIENMQRQELGFFEEATAIAKLMESCSMTQETAAIRLGLAQSTVANKLRILKLPPEEKEIITNAGLTERHARALLKITDDTLRKEALTKTVENGWTVDSLEKYIAKLQNDEAVKESYKKRAVMLKDVRLFFNTVNKAVSVMKLAGVDAHTKRVNHDGYIEYIIRIPSENV